MQKSLSLLMIFVTVIMLFFVAKPIEANATVEIVNNKVVLNTGFADEDEAFSHIIEKYKTMISFFSAIAAITMVAIFIYMFTKLGTTAGNPQERQKCITGLIITGIAAALLGSVSLFVGLFYGLFQ